MKITLPVRLYIFLFLLSYGTFVQGQTSQEQRMKNVVSKLTGYLKVCDTTAILNLYDTSFFRDYKMSRSSTVKEILNSCALYNNIIRRDSLSKIDDLKFVTDSLTGARIAILSLMRTADTALDLKHSDLIVKFYPRRLFKRDQFLFFYIKKERFVPEPNRLKPIDKNLPIDQRYKLNF